MTGVDVSSEMVKLAQVNVPEGQFICQDVMSADFEDASFNAVVAFYSIFHLPREEHEALFRNIYRWLKPGGYFLCTLSRQDDPAYTEDDFFGKTMYWSNYALPRSLETLEKVGFEVLEVRSTAAGWKDEVEAEREEHPLVLVRK